MNTTTPAQPVERSSESTPTEQTERRRGKIGQFFYELLRVYMGMIGITHPDERRREAAALQKSTGSSEERHSGQDH